MSPPLDHEERPSLLAFGQHLKRLRISAGYTQETLAERAGLSSRLISNLERGSEHQPRRSTVESLAAALGLSDSASGEFLILALGAQVEPNLPGISPPHGAARLPVPGGALIGRTREIASLASTLCEPEVRVLTLTGAGGVGKTRLAIEAANAVGSAFPDGITLVELAAARTQDQGLAEIVHALNIQTQPGVSSARSLENALREKRVLLILDNTEQITSGFSEIADLIAHTDFLKILATSRTKLNIRGERLFSVEPLQCPHVHHELSVDEVAASPAVALFVDRATAVHSEFRLDDDTALDVARIVCAVDGLPLAIELAAARMSVLSPSGLLAMMDRKLSVLTRGASDLPSRLQTMRSAVDWSYELLDMPCRELLQKLSTFEGGFTLQAAEAIHIGSASLTGCAPQDVRCMAVLENLLSLVEAHLVQVVPSPATEQRFRLLETVREFASEKLSHSGAREDALRAHARYFVRFAEDAAAGLSGPDQRAWLCRMELERDNVRAAISWSVLDGDPVSALKLATSYAYYWQIRGGLREGRNWLESSLEAAREAPPSVRALALVWLGVLRYHLGVPGQERTFEEALELFESQQDAWGRAFALRHLGNVERSQGRFDHGDRIQHEALQVFRALGDDAQICATLRNLGLGAYDRQDHSTAMALLDEALRIGKTVEEHLNLGSIYNNLALVHLALGDLQRAAELQVEALGIWVDLEYDTGIASCMENAALIGAKAGMNEYAALQFGAAEELRRRTGATGRTIDQRSNRLVTDNLKKALGTASYQNLKAHGQKLPRGKTLSMIRALPNALITSRAW